MVSKHTMSIYLNHIYELHVYDRKTFKYRKWLSHFNSETRIPLSEVIANDEMTLSHVSPCDYRWRKVPKFSQVGRGNGLYFSSDPTTEPTLLLHYFVMRNTQGRLGENQCGRYYAILSRRIHKNKHKQETVHNTWDRANFILPHLDFVPLMG